MTPEEQAALDLKTAGIWMVAVTVAGGIVQRHMFSSKASADAVVTKIEAALNGDRVARMVRFNSAEGTVSYDLFAIQSVRAINEIAYLRANGPWAEQKAAWGVSPGVSLPVSSGGAA